MFKGRLPLWLPRRERQRRSADSGAGWIWGGADILLRVGGPQFRLGGEVSRNQRTSPRVLDARGLHMAPHDAMEPNAGLSPRRRRSPKG